MELLLEASRFVTYAAALQLFGVAAFQFGLAPANLRVALDPWAHALSRLIGGAMVCLATINRYVFVPAIPKGGPGLKQLAHGTIAEIVLSAGVLALVSIIGTLAPG